MNYLTLKSSRLAIILLASCYLTALLALRVAAVEDWCQWTLFSLLILMAGRQLCLARKARLQGPWAFELHARSCCLNCGNGQRRFQPPRIDYLSENLIILSLIPDSPGAACANETPQAALAGRRKLILLPDSLSPADDWCLRVYLQRLRDQQGPV